MWFIVKYCFFFLDTSTSSRLKIAYLIAVIEIVFSFPPLKSFTVSFTRPNACNLFISAWSKPFIAFGPIDPVKNISTFFLLEFELMQFSPNL